METQTKFLTLSGILPFFLSLMAFIFEIEPAFALKAALAYGAVIASFIAGMHFMLFLLKSEILPPYLLYSSNGFALLSWVALLLPQADAAFLILNIAFIGLYYVELRLKSRDIWPQWFRLLRFRATVSVVALLFIFMAVV